MSATIFKPDTPFISHHTVGAASFRAFCERVGSILSAPHLIGAQFPISARDRCQDTTLPVPPVSPGLGLLGWNFGDFANPAEAAPLRFLRSSAFQRFAFSIGNPSYQCHQ
jgi:hypothetical protein